MKKIGQNILAMLTVLVVTLSFVQITYAASSSYSFTMNYRLADGKDNGQYHTLDKGNVDIDGTLIETSTDQGALKTYNDVCYVLFRDCLGPDKECGKMVCKNLQNPSGRIGLADQKSSKYYLQVYKVEDDGHNIAGSGTLYNE